jgi:hypothetical protein
MKTILLATHEAATLQLLIEVDGDKVFAAYFINGIEVTDINRVKSIYMAILIAMLNNYCESNKLIKWSY